MSELPSLHASEFGDYFRAVHGYEPFPWQRRLADRVATGGEWPRALDLPTGSGKTAALDVAVFTLALQAGTNSRTLPLRIVYVVDRRTIVDQAYDRAKAISCKLRGSDADVLRRVRERLASYSSESVPLATALLRGGIARDDTWVLTPDQPVVAISTVDQVGSRLLFRGYGVTDEMRVIHAGLLGNDALYLLDEVHLSQPFKETLTAVCRYRTMAASGLGSPFVVVPMSATPGTREAGTFDLEEADWRDPVLSRRLHASKQASLVRANAKSFEGELEKHVGTFLDRPGATAAVVVNRVKTARDVHKRLCDSVGTRADVQLLTGRMRPFDRDELELGLIGRVRAGRTRSAEERPTVVVATQTIEAGADFDFDDLVTECASLDALRQRFGRLDRRGELAGSARAVVVVRSDSLVDDPVYGDAIGNTWEWLQSIAADGRVDFGIKALQAPEDVSHLLAPREHAPTLLPHHLDSWVQTSPAPEPDPDVALWLHGPRRAAADVQVIWRADLSENLLRQAVASGDAKDDAWDIALGVVEALPPVTTEAMSVPLAAVKRWLEGGPESESYDVEGAMEDVDSEIRRRDDGEQPKKPRPALVWRGEKSQIVFPSKIRPGQTIVVPACYGGISSGNWDPSSRDIVRDVAEFASLKYGKPARLRLHPKIVRQMLGERAWASLNASFDEDNDSGDDRERVEKWIDERLAELRERPNGSQVAALFERLQEAGKTLRLERLPLGPAEDDGEYLLVSRRRPSNSNGDRADDQATADGPRSSFTGATGTLAKHVEAVGARAAHFAEHLRLPDAIVKDLRLSGTWHDAGKADVRFQRWLHGGSEFKALVQPEPRAKSTVRLASRRAINVARERAGYPRGGRHELTSVALMTSASDRLRPLAADWTLVLHLVASHHGYCRPFAPWVPDPAPVNVTYQGGDVSSTSSSAHHLERLDSGVAERFWQMVERHGWWGLAWIEAMLRLADHRQSECEQKI